MNPFEFVLILIAMMFIFGVVRHKMGIPARSMRQMRGDPEDTQETQRLKQEVSELKERIKVLERIAVEKEDTLSRQINDLRDR
jgi:hypothetical protein